MPDLSSQLSTELLFARGQMATSLAFHIVFASVGVAMPLFMTLAEWLGLRRRDPEYLRLARTWAKGTAVFFAVGAVSGTVLSFELGLLFPGLMGRHGAVLGVPFALEGFAFFTEAIFLGLYLYGWERLRPALHVACGAMVAVSGAASAVFVTFANAWMHAPVPGGAWAALQSPYAWHEVPHSLLASLLATAAAVAAIHARGLLKGTEAAAGFHRRALGIALAVLVPTALLQPLVGHFAGQQVGKYQPMKLAAMEAHFETSTGAPLHLGGIVDYEAKALRYAIPLPYLLSFLATNRFDGEVKGLSEFPRADWPSPLVRYCFQVMLACGTALALLAAWAAWLRARLFTHRRFLGAVVVAGPLGLLALETGWIFTEVGRQPWVVYGLLRTSEAVTPVPGLAAPFTFFSLLYVGLAVMVGLILRRHVRRIG